MIDLHSHSTESDGSYSPAELVNAAQQAGLEALAITDHDTFAGFEQAVPLARAAGLDLVCGIELSTKIHHPVKRTVHLLAYFVNGGPAPEFRDWILGLQSARRDRNKRLAARLQSMGVDIKLEEVEAIGRRMAGRPHFARLMVEKGYCANTRAAFDNYLDEAAPGYVDRDEPTLADAIQRTRQAGGISSLAHPVRLGKHDRHEEEKLIAFMCQDGLQAIEVFHSDHDAGDVQRYLQIARKFGLKITGGSDFHGENKPSVSLGTGIDGNLHVPLSVLDELRQPS